MVNLFGSSKQYVHHCTLPPKKDVLSEYITEKILFFKTFKLFCLISPNEYYRKIYRKSMIGVEREQIYQLKYYYYFIHPFSIFRYYWEILMLSVYVTRLFLTPIFILIEEYPIFNVLLFLLITDFICVINIVIQFFTAYFDAKNNKIIFNPKKIFLKYFSTLFIFDFVASLPVPLYLYRNNVSVVIVRYAMYLTFLNIFSFFSYSETIKMKRDFHFHYFRFFQMVFLYFLGLFWFTSLSSNVVAATNEITKNVVTMLYWLNRINCLMLGQEKAGLTLCGPNMILKYFIILYGFILRYTIVAYMVVLCRNYYILQRKYKAVFIELNEFMRYKRLPPSLVEKINSFYTFKYGKYFYDSEEVWNSLPDNYRDLTEKSIYSVWLNSDIFKSCKPQLLQGLMSYVKSQIYVFNDKIYKCGEQINGFYFLRCGTIAFYDTNGKEAFHLEEGAFFSDAALLLTENLFHKYSAIAIESCEVFTLERIDFENVMERFPDQYDIIMNNLTNVNKKESFRRFSDFRGIKPTN